MLTVALTDWTPSLTLVESAVLVAVAEMMAEPPAKNPPSAVVEADAAMLAEPNLTLTESADTTALEVLAIGNTSTPKESAPNAFVP